MDMSTWVSHVVLGCSVFLMFQMPVSTENEAVNSSSQLITQRATSDSVTLTLPSGSRCIGKFSRLCLKKAESELHCEVPDVEYIKADNLTVINRLQPNTSYILKTENETLENCSVRIHTCPGACAARGRGALGRVGGRGARAGAGEAARQRGVGARLDERPVGGRGRRRGPGFRHRPGRVLLRQKVKVARCTKDVGQHHRFTGETRNSRRFAGSRH